VDGQSQTLAQFDQGGVGLRRDQHGQAEIVVVVHLGGGAAGMGPGGERAGLAAALQQAADPGGTHAEPGGDLWAGAAALVTGAHHPLAEVLGVGFHA
jgi:hypothetical protein